jgi:hypothetical protein
MGSQKPILGAAKPDLVAVILERSVAQQLALALAWALGSTGDGKSQVKTGGSPGPAKDAGAAPKLQVVGGGTTAKKSPAKKSPAKKSGAKKSGGK